MSDLIIEVGKFYKTRGGEKARIYAVDGANEWTIHGAVFKYGEWFQYMWRSDGSAGNRTVFNTPEQCNSDLVSPWIDPPVVDWDRLPKHIVAVAMDIFGDWYGYLFTPRYCSGAALWWPTEPAEYNSIFPIKIEHRPAFTGDWRDSLAVRPGCGE